MNILAIAFWLLIVLPIALILLTAVIREIAFHLLPRAWIDVGRITKVPVVRAALVSIYCVLAVALMAMILDAGYRRMTE